MSSLDFIKDFPFTVNDINKPKELKGKDALGFIIKKLILMEKGTFQSVPNMGVGILNYRYTDTAEAHKLKNEIESQIETYLPYFTSVEIEFKTVGKSVYINIILDSQLLTYEITESDNKIDLSDLINK